MKCSEENATKKFLEKNGPIKAKSLLVFLQNVAKKVRIVIYSSRSETESAAAER